MKKKLLGWLIIILNMLIIIYFIEMTSGWEMVIRAIKVTGTFIGVLAMVFSIIVGISLISGESDNLDSYDV